MELYDSLGWREEVDDVADFHIAGAPFGGPIAMVRDTSRLVSVAGDRASYKHAGHLHGGRTAHRVRSLAGQELTCHGLTKSEALVCVLEDGRGLVYDMHGNFRLEFRLLKTDSTERIARCHIWGDGLVALCPTHTAATN